MNSLLASAPIRRTIFALFVLLGIAGPLLHAQPAAPDLTDQLFLNGWNAAVGITFDESGVMYVWEKGGRIYVVENGVKRAAPLLDISDEVGNWRDFGMLGVAFDPNYFINGYVYCYYVVDRHFLMNYDEANPPGASYNPNADEYFNATIGRITRFTVNNPGSHAIAAADESTRLILLGDSVHNGVPIVHQSHGTGSLFFGDDGTLLATAGDGASYSATDAGGSVGGTYVTQALADGIIDARQNVGAFRSQMLGSLNGKVMRINPSTGEGYPSNPFYDSGNPGSVRSKVWGLGLRNPFRFNMVPNTGSHFPADGDPGTLMIGDVGWGTWEDLHVCDEPGENFGWPLFEGMYVHTGYFNASPFNQEAPTPAGCSQAYYRFRDLLKQSNPGGGSDPFTDPCGGLIDPAQTNLFVHSKPEIDWRHGQNISRVSINGNVENIGNGATNSIPGSMFGGNCAVGGAFYTGDDLPVEYKNTLFTADYGAGWIRNVGFDPVTNDPLWVREFDLDLPNKGSVVAIATDPFNGGLYYIRYGSEVREFIYNPGGNLPPVAAATQSTSFGPSPLTVTFDASTSSDPENGVLTYLWKFGDGATSTSVNPTHVYTAATSNPTQFDAVLVVTDDNGAKDSLSLVVSANNTPPVIVATSVDTIDTYKLVNPTQLRLFAEVTDTEHALSSLEFQWQVALYHNDHNHPEPVDIVSYDDTINTVLSPLGCDGAVYFYRVSLTVIDPAGLATTYSHDISPDCGAPQAINDVASYPDGGIVYIPVLDNDLTSTAFDTSSLAIVSPPLHGTATVDYQTGQIIYTHDGLSSPNDQFEYTIEDDLGRESNIGLIDLTLLGPASVSINSPADGATLSAGDITVTFSATGNLTGADHVHLKMDNDPHNTMSGVNGSFVFTNVSAGPHTITATLVDASHQALPNPEATTTISINVLAVGGGSGLYATYFNSIDLTGPAVVTRIDPQVDFNWGTGSPDPLVTVNNFSAIWEGQVQALYSETYTFETNSDDGIRLWVDGQLIIDAWIDQAPTIWNGTVDLTAGDKFNIKIEYYENGGGAVASLRWSSPSQAYEVVPQAYLFPYVQPPYSGEFDLVGNAASTSDSCVLLTPAINTQTGAAWWPAQLDLTEAFDISLNVNLGANDANGADGMAFVLQNVSTSSIGSTGGGLGAAGISPSVVVELDGYNNNNASELAEDHIAISLNGNLANPVVPAIQASATSANIEDGLDHDFRVVWDPTTQTLDVYFDGSLRASYVADLQTTVFGGNSFVYFGMTAGTGGLSNLQSFCLEEINLGLVPPVADFVATPLSGQAPLDVAFDASTSTDADGSIVNYAWDFGDGNNGSGPTPSHVYATDGTFIAELTVTDNDGLTSVAQTTITVDGLPLPTPLLEQGIVSNVGGSWQTIALNYTYTNMVVVTTPVLASGSQLPVVSRIQNASGNSFDLRLQGFAGNVPSGYEVHYLVVEAGAYTLANDGVQMEAGTFNSNLTAGQGNWITEARTYQQPYSNPIVFGQVMSYNDANWSVFWANGNSRAASPSATSFHAGKNVGEDPNTTRADETIGYIVFESGNGTVNGVDFVTGVGSDNVKGLENNSNGFFYPIAGLTQPEVAIVSMGAGMDASDGGWPILFGSNPVTSSGINLLIDEDQVVSTERRHSTESLPYVVFEGGPVNLSPTAIAVADQSQGNLSLTVNFDASASFDIDGSIVSYDWDLGNGSSATGSTTSETYGPGNFEVVLTVTDDLGATDTDTVQISVDGPNQPPTASFLATPNPAQIGQAVGFDASGSSDSDGTIVSYAWDFDDLGNTATGINPTYTFSDTGWYAVELIVTDDEGAIGSLVQNVRVDTVPVATGVKYEVGILTNVGDAWQTVALNFSYTNMVVVTTPLLTSGSQLPVVSRIDNASGNGFDLRLQGFAGNIPAGYSVHYLVVEAGAYTLANDGVKMEAGTFNSSLTAGVGNWITEARSYQQAYTLPVVLGQVMSYNDPNWSVFWANGSGRSDSPTPSAFNAGKNVGEDPNTTRANETLGYVVFESGNGSLNGTAFDAGVGSDIVKALENSSSGFVYPLNGLVNPEVAIVSMGGGMDATDGGWPILFGANPVTSSALNLLIDEDQVVSTERRHSTEAVAFVAFEGVAPRLRKPGSLEVSIFPNPFSDHVQVQIAGQLSGEIQVELYNAVGQLIQVQSFDKANFTMMLEQGLPDGVYLMRVKAGSAEFMQRLVKRN